MHVELYMDRFSGRKGLLKRCLSICSPIAWEHLWCWRSTADLERKVLRVSEDRGVPQTLRPREKRTPGQAAAPTGRRFLGGKETDEVGEMFLRRLEPQPLEP